MAQGMQPSVAVTPERDITRNKASERDKVGFVTNRGKIYVQAASSSASTNS